MHYCAPADPALLIYSICTYEKAQNHTIVIANLLPSSPLSEVTVHVLV